MGGSESKPVNEKLNVGDLKSASTYALTGGRKTDAGALTEKDFAVIFEAKAKAAGLIPQNETLDAILHSEAAKKGSAAVEHALDVNGDGVVDAKDFEIMFGNYVQFLDNNQKTFDKYLPFVGQCTFGTGVGYACGYAARSVYSYKTPILVAGALGYTGAQYMIQQDFMNQELMVQAAQMKVKNMLDINKDGVLNRKDIDELMENKMKVVNRKLGPGGFAPGAAGTATFGLGMALALRVARRR
ncbi:hypothetical protein DIPPA_00737 [Diplonema papillatum]|nr:hypothetical protein DIPPA_00737 [Diplonema papillatum]|eukprot:gene4420-6848_t